MSSNARYDAFLSYNSQDRPAVEELAGRLESEGLELFLERWELRPGCEFQPALAQGLRDSKTCVVFLGPNGLGPWQKQELQVAIDKRARDEAFHVIPVLLPGAERPRRGDVAHLEFLINASWVEFLKTLDDERAFRSLVWGIKGTKPLEPDKRYEGVCPYRGLEAFRPEDAKFFFGRENLTGWLVSALRREVRAPQGVRFLAVLGPSGSGKSSVVLAGLVPRLKEGAIDGSEHWSIAVVCPGDDPLRNLVAELFGQFSPAGAVPDVSQARKLIGDLRDDEQALDLFTRMVLHSAPAESRLLVVVDQFEEVFTYRPQDGPVRARFEQDRDQFFANLLHAAATPGGRVAVVLTMRSDFLGPCASFERLNNVLNAHLIQVGPMREDELRAAIEQPAFKVGCELEPRLTERLLRDVEGQAGALPLLQFTLDEVWKRRDVRRLTLRAYTELGKDDRGQERGIEGVLDHRANEIYRNLTPENQDLCRRLFLRLVQPGEGTEVTKRRVSYRELLPDDPARAEVIRKLVQSLASRDARLITTEGTGATEGAFEVAHEALIRGWKQLRQWIDADREFLWSWDRLRATARYWEKEGRRRDLLLPEGRLLAEAEDLLLCHESELDPDGIAYARASITKNNRRGLYNWILLCSFLTIPTLLWGGHDLVSVDSARAAYSKTFQFHFNNNDVIWGSVAGIPFSIFPLWVTYRKWRGRPGFKTIYLDKVFWSINLALSLMIIIITSAMIYYNVISIHLLFIIVLYTVFAIVTAALLWDTARVDRYYRRRRDRLCALEIVRKRSTLVSKAGLTFALFVLALADLFGLLALPSILERKNALELYQAHREIADYQIRDGQFGRALDSLNRARALAFSEGMTTFPARKGEEEAERMAATRHYVETLARMGVVLRLAGKPQEADRKFREALGMIHNPWPAFKELKLKYLLNDSVAPVGRWTSYFVEPPNHYGVHPEHLEQAIEYDTRLPLLILASKMGAAPTVAQILGNGADIETRAEDGPTALIMAAATGHADVVKQLLASGADVGARTQDGVTALMAAAFYGRVQVVETLLQHGAKVNATDRAGGTALMASASAGHADVVKQLLAAGSDRWLRRWNGETAATLASIQEYKTAATFQEYKTAATLASIQEYKDVLASLFGVESFSIELMQEKATEPGRKDAARLADALICAGDLAIGRSGDFGKAASLYHQALEAMPERDAATLQRLPVLVRFSIVKAEANEYDVALQYTERSIAVSKALAERYPETPLVRQQIANLYGQLACCELFCKRSQRAIAAACTALELDASQVWIKIKLAHGLLLAGQFEEAKDLYLENRSVRFGNERQNLARVVFRDFRELRANGISHPDMERIEKLLQTENGAGDIK